MTVAPTEKTEKAKVTTTTTATTPTLYDNIEKKRQYIIDQKTEQERKHNTIIRIQNYKHDSLTLKDKIILHILNKSKVPMPTNDNMTCQKLDQMKTKLEAKVNANIHLSYVDNNDGLLKINIPDRNTMLRDYCGNSNGTDNKNTNSIYGRLTHHYCTKYGINFETWNYLENNPDMDIETIKKYSSLSYYFSGYRLAYMVLLLVNLLLMLPYYGFNILIQQMFGLLFLAVATICIGLMVLTLVGKIVRGCGLDSYANNEFTIRTIGFIFKEAHITFITILQFLLSKVFDNSIPIWFTFIILTLGYAMIVTVIYGGDRLKPLIKLSDLKNRNPEKYRFLTGIWLSV